MKGYFSKLMENTGSIFGKSRTQTRVEPIHCNLTTRVEPHPTSRSDKPPEQGKSKTPEPGDLKLITERSEDLKENRVQSLNPVTDQASSNLQEQKSEDGQRLSHHIETQPEEKQKPDEIRSDPPETETAISENIKIVVHTPSAENKSVIKNSQSHPLPQPSPARRTLKQKSIFKEEKAVIIGKIKDSDPISAEREKPESKLKKQVHATKRIHFKEVREWVAKTPGSDGIQITPVDDIHDQKPTQSDRSRCDDGVGVPIRKKPEPEIQDIQLSIGTVSLIVDKTTTELQAQQPPQPRSATGPESETGSSRLWRYYLRDR